MKNALLLAAVGEAATGVALEKLKKIDVEPGKPFDITKVDSKLAEGLEKAVKEVQIKMAEGVTKMKNVNGWINMTNLGRYGTDYETRAGVAYMGLGADLREQKGAMIPLSLGLLELTATTTNRGREEL